MAYNFKIERTTAPKAKPESEAKLGFDGIDAPLSKVVSARHQNLLEVNKTALKLGYDY